METTNRMDDAALTRTKLAPKQRMARMPARRRRAHVLFDLTGHAGRSGDLIGPFGHIDRDVARHRLDRVVPVLP